MTCQDVHNGFDRDLRFDNNPRLAAALAEHIATCLPCNRLVQEQKELAEQLHFVRDSAPPVPASLDHAVSANYRSLVLERSGLARSIPLTHRINPRAALGWAAAAAFAVVVAYGGMLLFVPRQHVWVDRQSTIRPPMLPHAPTTANEERTRAQIITRQAPKSHGDFVKPANRPASFAEQDNSFPARFQSLMYCDQISCPGAMEVIRVRLPSPVMGLTPASARMDGAVSADILVGPDGIARGIRVVE